MYIDFSALFHRSSKDRTAQGRVKIPLDPSLWPLEWQTIQYKTYPRIPKVALTGERPAGDFWSTMHGRASDRDFDKRELDHRTISLLLKYACGILSEGDTYHRAQPSGGGLYPIEIYALVFVPTQDIATGAYHYGVKEHELAFLWERQFSADDVGQLFSYPWAKNASVAFVITGVFHRNQVKYGERGYRHVLIEAGAIVQNLYLTAAALGLRCCAIDGVRESNIERILDIDGITESAICTVLVG